MIELQSLIKIQKYSLDSYFMNVDTIQSSNINNQQLRRGRQNGILGILSKKEFQNYIQKNEDDLAYVCADTIRQISKGVNINFEEISLVQYFLKKYLMSEYETTSQSKISKVIGYFNRSLGDKNQIFDSKQKKRESNQYYQKYILNPENLILPKKYFKKYLSDKSFQEIFQIMFNNKQIFNPLEFVIKRNIDVKNLEVLFYVLSDQMRQAGRSFYKSSGERLIKSFHGQLIALSTDSITYQLTLQETIDLTYEKIASDEVARLDFIRKLKKSLSLDLKVQESQINILSIEKGSIIVIFEVVDASKQIVCQIEYTQQNFPDNQPELQLHKYFVKAGLSVNDFNPKYDMNWNKYKFGNYENRGPKGKPQPYFYPVGWQGYGLNLEMYGKNDKWLMADGNDEEWYVMFHGTKFEGLQGIMEKKVVDGKVLERNFVPGSGQNFSKSNCILTGQLIGDGVYFSNHIEVCERYYTSSTQIGDQKFIVAFQVRVKPLALRQVKKKSYIDVLIDDYKKNNKDYDKNLDDMTLWDNDYFVVNDPKDIRPYRILLKNVNEHQENQFIDTFNQFQNQMQETLNQQFLNCKPQLKLHDYFKMAGLSPDDFDPKYNKVWDNYQFGNCCQRGPKGKALPYFYPVGWKGYALKVKGKYDNGNDNWLNKNNNQEEWYVMYHGTKIQFVKGIMEHGLKPGTHSVYADHLCQLTGNMIGKGVYISNHIEVCVSYYTSSTQIGDQKFNVAFQVRVRPSALRQCKKKSYINDLIDDYKKNNKDYDKNLDDMTLWDNDYFVVNDPKDIRPYRILLKRV